MLKIVRKSTLEALHADVNSKQKKINDLIDVVDNLEASNKDLKSRFEECYAANERHHIKARERDASNSNLKEQIKTLDSTIYDLNSKIEKLESQLEESIGDVNLIHEKAKSLQEKVDYLEKDNQNLKTENGQVTGMKSTIDGLRGHMDDAHQTILELRKSIDSRSKTLQHLETNYDKLYNGVQSAIKALKNHRGKLPDGANKALKALTGIIPDEPCETAKDVKKHQYLSKDEGLIQPRPEEVKYDTVSDQKPKRKYQRKS